MREFVAVDAGGTSTRAVVVDEEGRCRGYGRSTSGNPTSAGAGPAAAAVGAAIEQALAAAAVDPTGVEAVLVAHAGGHADYEAGIAQRLSRLGVGGVLARVGDLAALFASGTHEQDGAAMLAGTGAIGGAIRGGALVRTVDGTGWLLGDSGSGFWIGHRVARAVVDALDGGPSTALTSALLATLGVLDDHDYDAGRPRALDALMHGLFALRPVELSRFAPLAFALVGQDAVADGIVRDGVDLMTSLLLRVRAIQSEGPLVFGGSVLVEGYLRLDAHVVRPLLDAAGASTPIPVADGLVGAAVLALRAGGVAIDAPLFARLAGSIREAAGAWRAPV
ncbi:N-acetylglucosamine kinase [uncultured Amnibacterium sp.]|uniref:N-acetylglucosamine kinase n=1 Tax=uncultured Amnibacterium sp. TaxID=1631851 RepID=UPI0035CA3862